MIEPQHMASLYYYTNNLTVLMVVLSSRQSVSMTNIFLQF